MLSRVMCRKRFRLFLSNFKKDTIKKEHTSFQPFRTISKDQYRGDYLKSN